MSNSDVFKLLTCIYPRGSENTRKESEWFIDISNDRRFQFFGFISPIYARFSEQGTRMEALSRRVLEGRLENLPPEKKTDVAVFLSSTFTGACLLYRVRFFTYKNYTGWESLY